jgi:DNA-binding CsgD family transcriptional regulator
MSRGPDSANDRSTSTSHDLWEVVKDLELSMALVNSVTYRMEAATEAFLESVGRTPSEVVDHPAFDLFEKSEEASVKAALDALNEGKIEFYRTHRMLVRPHSTAHRVSVWVHVVDFGKQRYALTELSLDTDTPDSPLVKFLGQTPPALVFGMTDDKGVVTSVSNDVESVMGVKPKDLVGKPLLEATQLHDATRLLDATPTKMGRTCLSLRMHSKIPSAHPKHLLCLVTCFVETDNYGFILIPETESTTVQAYDRAAELEQRLWRIASEVQASGIFEHLWSFPDAQRFPQLSTLSARQWEVLSRLLRGQRVSIIAEALFVSESTVRNNLSTIFHKFGVHSQAELLKLFSSEEMTKE